MIAPNESLAGQARPVTLPEIEAACEHFARTRARAEKLMAAVEKKRQAILDEHAAELNSLAQELAVARGTVALNVEYGREFFRKPKTATFHGITVGFEKQRDGIAGPPDEVLIPRIEKLLKEKAGALVHTTKVIVREAFKRLTRPELQMLGCQFVAGADKVVVRPESKTDVEKYFAACTAAVEQKKFA